MILHLPKIQPSINMSLTQIYLNAHDLQILKGDDSPNIFLPFLLIDAMYIVRQENIHDLPKKHTLKHYYRNWDKNYEQFIKDFFRIFTEEQQFEIIDKMDEFNLFIKNELQLFKISVMNRFMDYDTDVRLILSDTLACNILAQSAQIVYGSIHKKPNNRTRQYETVVNTHIKGMEQWSHKFLAEYGDSIVERTKQRIDLTEYSPVADTVKNLCTKIAQFKF